jgi:hypothetical protein
MKSQWQQRASLLVAIVCVGAVCIANRSASITAEERLVTLGV